MAEFSFAVEGETTGTASAATLTVVDPPAPVAYDAAGITSCTIHCESVLALAMRARTRRLTHEDQISRPGRATDEGFSYADQIAKGTYTFFTKGFQQSAGKGPKFT